MKIKTFNSSDLLTTKEREKQYNKHLKKIQKIKRDNFGGQYEKIQKESKKISETMHRAKSQMRKFKIKQKNENIKEKDEKMMKRIASFKSSYLKGGPSNLQKLKKSNKNNHMKEYYVQCQNKKLADCLQNNFSVDSRKYQEKLAKQRESYIQLRERIQRFKTNRTASQLSKKKLEKGKHGVKYQNKETE